MKIYRHFFIVLILSFFAYSCSESNSSQSTDESVLPIVSYCLGTDKDVKNVYPDSSWLPSAYKQYYTDYFSTISYFTGLSLQYDSIAYDSVVVRQDNTGENFFVDIYSTDSSALHYASVHPQFVKNYAQACKGISTCQHNSSCEDTVLTDTCIWSLDDTCCCWNNHDTIESKPWAFFPQIGLPMVNQHAILLLNYPPTTALTDSSYLNTFTMNRWSRVLEGAGITTPVFYETIIDIRPIAAPGSNTSQYLPDAQTYFNDSTETTGGYYITPQLLLMLDPPTNKSETRTLPLVILGGPARGQWKEMTGLSDTILSTGVFKFPGAEKETPYIVGNHPDVTSYQCCPGDTYYNCDSYNLEKDELIDLQIACWQKSMYENPDQDPVEVLAACKERWVTKRSAEDNHTLCVLEKMDNNNWGSQCKTKEKAEEYCNCHDDNPCYSYNCDSCATDK